ncbi:glycosyl transferase [Oleisolibacter albus]|uniref:glycosyl transferase n=1 Tax=Oleisolibacter albus TaxID=2171757 RepID=UPI000DF2CADC|nr:glycosyl transferase [Oleisolibacter albus]
MGLLCGLVPAWIVVALHAQRMGAVAPLLCGVGAVALVSWLDDLRSRPAWLRLLVQTAAVAAGLQSLPDGTAVFQGLLPVGADRLLTGILWLWFINAYNFMDGIDGLTAAETISIGLGLMLVANLASIPGPLAGWGAVLAGAALGFLPWNWHPARLFLGDVGSISLGFLVGWLLVLTAAEGAWAPALILPAFYLVDATITLLRRMATGHSPLVPHRTHAYQRAAVRMPHHHVVLRIILGNSLLLGLASYAALWPGAWLSMLMGAAVIAAALYLWLHGSATALLIQR